MEQFTRRIKENDGKFHTRTHTVYTQEEAEDMDLDYLHDWREAEPGDYALTDDGYVGECITKDVYEDSSGQPSVFLKFSFARVWVTRTGKLLWLKRKKAGAFYLTKAQTWSEAEAKRKRTKRAVTLFATYVVMGKKPDYAKIGRTFRPDERDPAASAKRLLRNPDVQKMVDKKIRELLATRGITEEKVIDKYEETYKEAKKHGHTGTMKSITDVYRDMLGLDQAIGPADGSVYDELEGSSLAYLAEERKKQIGKQEVIDYVPASRLDEQREEQREEQEDEE